MNAHPKLFTALFSIVLVTMLYAAREAILARRRNILIAAISFGLGFALAWFGGQQLKRLSEWFFLPIMEVVLTVATLSAAILLLYKIIDLKHPHFIASIRRHRLRVSVAMFLVCAFAFYVWATTPSISRKKVVVLRPDQTIDASLGQITNAWYPSSAQIEEALAATEFEVHSLSVRSWWPLLSNSEARQLFPFYIDQLLQVKSQLPTYYVQALGSSREGHRIIVLHMCTLSFPDEEAEAGWRNEEWIISDGGTSVVNAQYDPITKACVVSPNGG